MSHVKKNAYDRTHRALLLACASVPGGVTWDPETGFTYHMVSSEIRTAWKRIERELLEEDQAADAVDALAELGDMP